MANETSGRRYLQPRINLLLMSLVTIQAGQLL